MGLALDLRSVKNPPFLVSDTYIMINERREEKNLGVFGLFSSAYMSYSMEVEGGLFFWFGIDL